ncbi:Uncharacterized protein LOK49_LG01G01487 [Camellia lanceoleosa]|uniref:Uncharacterized protein n=1 Tax=Camellia lanceoleosa TaxID=1840588 RepID=A0ACC0IUQ6_9ERIC|nr:Uncharacterized protein LOK49_LG01G01487 [Camellia lanceoleosa]
METPVKSFNPNKHLKEQFVSNLTGSSMLEVIALATAVPALILLRHCFCSADKQDPNTMKISLKKNDDVIVAFNSWRDYMALMIMDFLSIVLPILLFFTVLSEWTCLCAVLLILLLIFSIVAKRHRAPLYVEDEFGSLRANISSYRVSIMIVTCLCILAVDFKIFPRRHAKTETYGTSLMDLGGLLDLFPQRVDYQVHVGEYGVHWNFFFTLAAVSILTSIINVPPKYSGILGSLILVGYQAGLMREMHDLMAVEIMLVEMHGSYEEGDLSLGIETLDLYQSWAAIFSLETLGKCRDPMNGQELEFGFSLFCFVQYGLCHFCTGSKSQVLAILMLSYYIPGHKISVLEEAFNRNQLASFLLANLLTGLVNLFVDTLFASSVSALAILVVYTFILSLVVGFADFYGIKLKFW